MFLAGPNRRESVPLKKRYFIHCVVVVFLLVADWVVGKPMENEAAARKKLQTYVQLSRDIQQAFASAHYSQALVLCSQQAELAPQQADPHYNAACALAGLGKTNDAFAALDKAAALGFADAEHLSNDPDVALLHSDPRFGALVARLRENAVRRLEKLYEPGKPLPGVKTIEGNPEGGLRWRLQLLPSATAQKPQRLIVWLHPSGGSMNQQVEPLSPEFNKRGFALLVPTAKNWSSWTSQHLDQLMAKTLDDVAKVPGVDVKRPILFGFSAGGQMALEAYIRQPARIGGLILDAVYPVKIEESGRVSLMNLPKRAEDLARLRTVPVYAVVGGDDPGVRFWQQTQPIWQAADLPLTLTIVPHQGHAWLFGPQELAALYVWLESHSLDF